MGGEAGEVALDRLRVTNVRIDAGEERQLGLFGWDRNSSLRHQGQQTERLQRDSFPAGIGSANDQLLGGRRQQDGQRHGGCRRGV